MNERTYLVQYENQLLAFGFPPPDFFLQYPTSTPFGISRVEHKHDDVCFLDDLYGIQTTAIVTRDATPRTLKSVRT